MSQAELLIEEAPTHPFQFKNHPIRTQLEGGNLWFAARDVCEALTIKWNGRALSAIPDEWQGLRSFLTPSGNQQLRAILEPAVYKLAFRSNKPEADAFTNWIASEVVPSIRKTGRYEITETAVPAPDAALTPDQQCTLQAVVKGKVESIPADRRPRGLYPQIWSRFNNHFRLASYKQLPQSRLSEGIAYLMAMELPAPLPQAAMGAMGTMGDSSAIATCTPPVGMSSGRADALRRIESAIRTINAAQDVVRLFCHPGAKTMRMTPQERALYDAEHQLYANAIDTLYAASRTLEAGHALERLRSPQPGRSLPAGRM